jgi:putative MATE family efflux protein
LIENQPGGELDRGLQGRSLDGEILRLAIPAILQYLLHTLQFIVDTRMVSQASGGEDVSLAALNLVSPLCWSLTTVFTVTAIGASAIVSRRTGENRKDKASTATSTALLLALLIGAVVTLVGIAGREPWMAWLEQQLGAADSDSVASITHDAEGYLKWFLLLFPLRAVAVTLEATLRGAGESALPVIGGVVGNVANIVGNAVLLFGLWGAPRMGLEGVGLATGLAPLAEILVIMMVLMVRRTSRLSLSFSGMFYFDREQSREIIRVSAPALGAALLFHSGFVVYQFAIFGLDSTAMAAHRVAITIQSMAFLPAHGFQAAAASVSGRLLGAGHQDQAQRSAWRSSYLGVLLVLPVMVTFFCFAEGLTGLFGMHQETSRIAATCLMIGAIEVPFLMVSESLTGTLRGAGANIPVMGITAIGSWGFRVPFAWILGYGYLGFPELGLNGIWVATVLDWVVRSILLARVISHRDWLKTRV